MTIASSTSSEPLLVGTDRVPPAMYAAGRALQAPPGVTLVPTEDVLLLAVDLPVMPAAQRRASVGYAVEDRIAQTLDEVQVVLGPQVSKDVWLVAATAKSVLAGVTTPDASHALWPDVLLVPAPLAGWAVWCETDRVLVRLPDGTGFATSTAALPAFWAAAGSPAVKVFGSTIPPGLPVDARGDLPATPDPVLLGFDLRSGLNRAGSGLSVPKAARPFLAILLVTALAHLSLLVMDVVALNQLVGQTDSELRALLTLPEDADLDLAVAQALAARQPADNGGVLSLLSRTFAAIGAEAGRVSVQDLRYARDDDAIVLTLEAPDLGTLQAIETALAGASLSVTAGAATTSDGAAEVQMTVRGGGA